MLDQLWSYNLRVFYHNVHNYLCSLIIFELCLIHLEDIDHIVIDYLLYIGGQGFDFENYVRKLKLLWLG